MSSKGGGLSFGGELRRLRQEAGLTLEGLAEATGVSARTISDLERGRILGPQRRTVAALADGLRLPDEQRAALDELAGKGRPRPVTAPPGWCVPPRPVPDFTGRQEELAALAGLRGGSGTAAVVVLSGPGGVGKTTLAVEAGRRTSAASGKDLLYVDLRGLDARPLDTGSALFRLLKALGVGNRDIPEEVEARSGQWRALLTERPVVVVLDNAFDEEQVRPLLPGGGQAVAIVTSRRLLTGLEGVIRLTVPVLSPDEANALLTGIVGGSDQSPGLAKVVRLCGGLPLALRIAGNRLAAHPAWTAEQFADRLSDSEQRLQQLHAGDLHITAAFVLSYDQLSSPAKRLCRRLSLVPGPDCSAAVASVLIGASVPQTERVLEELCELGLLSQPASMRYGFHDLIRLFAQERLVAEESAGQRDRIRTKLNDWLLEVTIAAGRWFEPDYGTPPHNWHDLVDLSTPDDAQTWLQVEADNWLGALRAAAGDGRHAQVVTVAEALHWFSDHWLPWAYWPEVFGLASTAAAALDDPVLEATQTNYLSWSLAIAHDYEGALAAAEHAARLASGAGDVRQEAWAYVYAARSRLEVDPAAAHAFITRATELFETTEDTDGYMQSLLMLARASYAVGRLREAAAQLRAVIELANGEWTGTARQQIAAGTLLLANHYLGTVLEDLGEPDQADTVYRAALDAATAVDLPHMRAETLLRYGGLLRLRDPAAAEAMLREARDVFAEQGARAKAGHVDEMLAEWAGRTGYA